MDQNQFLQILEEKTLPLSIKNKEKDENSSKLIWKTAFDMLQKNQNDYLAIFSSLLEYSNLKISFIEEGIDMDYFNNFISNINSENTIDEIFPYFEIFLNFLPFLNSKAIILFINKISIILSNYIQQNQILPPNFLKQIKKTDFSKIKHKELKEINQHITNSIKPENISNDDLGFLFLISPFVGEIVLKSPTSSLLYINIINNLLKSEGDESIKSKQIVSLYLLQKISDLLSQIIIEDDEISISKAEKKEIIQKGDELFKLLLPLFITEDQYLFNLSHKTMRKLISEGVFVEHLKVVEMIKQYSKYKTDERVVLFFKLINKLMEDTETVTIPIAQPIYNLLGIISKRSTPLVQSLCLESYSLLAAVKKDVFEEVYEQELEIAQNLMNNNKNDSFILSKISTFISTLSKSLPETFSKIMKDFVPVLIDFIQSEETDREKERKNRLAIAETLSIIIDGGVYQPICDKICNFIIKAIDDTKENEIFYIGSIVISLHSQIIPELATNLFKKLTIYAHNCNSDQQLNITLQMMRKLISKQKVDSSIVFNFINDEIISGKIKMLHGMKPYIVCNNNTMIFYFISKVIKVYGVQNELSFKLSKELCEWVPKTRLSLLHLVLEPIIQSLSLNCFKEDNEYAKQFYTLLLNLLKLIPSQNSQQLSAIVSCLIEIINYHNDFVNAQDLLQIATETLARCHSSQMKDDIEEEEEEEDESENKVYTHLAKLVLTVYSIPDLNECEVKKDLIASVLEEIDEDSLPSCFTLIISLLKQTDRFKPVYLTLCRPIINLLLMKKDELEDVGISSKEADEGKNIVRNILRKNPLVKKQIQKDFNNSKQKLNRFNTLFK